MKLIYIGKEIYNNRYKSLFKSRQVETIHYRNPLKAIDNLTEIEPEVVVMVSGDFPRMWKIVLSEIKSFNNKIKFLLFGDLNQEEDKAFNFLKGDKYFKELEDGLKFLKSEIKCNFNNEVYYPENGEITLGYMNPVSFSFISGIVMEISKNHLLFQKDPDCDIEGLKSGDLIKDATINYGDNVTNLDLEINQLNDNINLLVKSTNPQFEELLSLLFV